MISKDENTEINILNELGELVAAPTKKYMAKGEESILHIDTITLRLASGIYYVSLAVNGEMYLRKIVIAGK